jgi:single-strand DNA-binding protein
MFNQVILFGRLTSNPEVKMTQSGQAVTNVTLAVERPKSKDGNQTADFINCTAWGKTAEMVGKYFTKGKPMLVVGSLRDNDYVDKNGVKHYSKIVNINSVSFTINDGSQGHSQPQQGTPSGYPTNYPQTPQDGHSVAHSTSQGYPPLPSEKFEDFDEILDDETVPF